MVDLAASVRLLLGLVILVYAALVVLTEPRVTRRIVLASVGVVPFLVWLISPGLLAFGDLELALQTRRVSLLAGAAAVAIRYTAMRSRGRSTAARRVLAAVSALMLLAAIAFGTANWLVAAPALVTAVASGLLTPSAASSDGDRPQRPHRQDT